MGLLLLVRHGQASFGAEDYDVLSETGWEQARVLGRSLAERGEAPGAVVHGGMRRHRETWEAIVAGARGQCRNTGADADESAASAAWERAATVDADWAEFDHLAVLAHHSASTGSPVDHRSDRRTFQAAYETATEHWASGAPGYPEPYADFVTRARAALDRAAATAGPTLVVSSGGVIAVLAALLVAPHLAPPELAPIWTRFNTVMANASVTRVIVGSTGARLLTFNEHAHLSRELITYR